MKIFLEDFDYSQKQFDIFLFNNINFFLFQFQNFIKYLLRLFINLFILSFI